jgi:hypothetical protein
MILEAGKIAKINLDITIARFNFLPHAKNLLTG